MDLFAGRLPWFIAGPLIGLLVAGLYAVANRPLGVSGAYVQVMAFVRGLPTVETWRVSYFVGLVAGAAVVTVLRGGPSIGLWYGTLAHVVPLVALVPLLFGAGILMGYGAAWAGGCTSGHGLCGTSRLSPASVVATATFMATAIAITAVVHFATGGIL